MPTSSIFKVSVIYKRECFRLYHITTNSHHRFKKHKNLIEEIIPSEPEQIWVSDIIHIGDRANPMYLGLVTDAYSKKIFGYDVYNSLNTEGSLRAMKMANKSRSYKDNILIHHSDRGLQCCSNEYQNLLLKSKIKCSMTGTYDPQANAIAERINSILKQEFIGENRNLEINTMKQLIKNSVEIYNDIRSLFLPHENTKRDA